MKTVAGRFVAILVPVFCHAQATSGEISAAQLQSVLNLPLTQAVKQRETYKAPLKAAYDRQIAMAGKDCQAESKAGQQPYNVCIGKADEQADKDFAIFYANLQMLCHSQDQLAALQISRKTWGAYKDGAMKAARAAWPEGSGAAGFAAQVYLSLLRDYMRELHEIFGLNIAQ